jgi:hypothetical protein
VASNLVVEPRAGHIDAIDGVLDVQTDLRIDAFIHPATGESLVMLHVDAMDDDGAIMAVGIPLYQGDTTRLVMALPAVMRMASGGTGSSDLLN